MAFLIDASLDAALAYLDNVTALYVCSQEPTTLTEATTTYALGNKTPPTIGAAQDRTGGGREREVAAFSDGSATATGTVTHWALVSGTELIATNAMSSSFDVASGGQFSLTAYAVGIPDAVSE